MLALCMSFVASAAAFLIEGGTAPPNLWMQEATPAPTQAGEAMLEAKTIPPEFWMNKETPGPPAPAQPIPNVLWVAQTAPPPTTAPTEHQACRGCDCLFTYPEAMIAGGGLKPAFTCDGGTAKVPHFRWAGAPTIKQPDCSHNPKTQSFAIIMEDLDYPYGVSQVGNTVRTMFAAWNIPGNWTHFDDTNAFQTYKSIPLVAIGKNDAGKNELEYACPEMGSHRYRWTIWSLNEYLDLDETAPYDQILPQLEAHELVRAQFYASVNAKYRPHSFLQETPEESRKMSLLSSMMPSWR